MRHKKINPSKRRNQLKDPSKHHSSKHHSSKHHPSKHHPSKHHSSKHHPSKHPRAFKISNIQNERIAATKYTSAG